MTSDLIAAGAPVNHLTRGKEVTPLDVAALNDDSVAVLSLLIAGAQPNLHQPSLSPLTTSAYRSNYKIFDMLLNCGADVNWPVMNLGTCLCIAAYAGAGDIMRRALQAGAMINLSPRFNYRYPLHFNCQLLMRGRDQEDESKEPQHGIYCPQGDDTFRRSPRAIARRMDDASLLLVAAGEDVSNVPYFKSPQISRELTAIRKERTSSLLNMSREVIRAQMLACNAGNRNLFQVVEQLPLPRLLQKYLVYNQTLDIQCEVCAKRECKRAECAGLK